MSSSEEMGAFFVETEIGKSDPVRIDIGNSVVVIGRNSDCDMIFGGQYISREHAAIGIVEGKPILMDSSTVGTWVNGVPMVKNQEFPLMGGDRINLGSEHTVLMIGDQRAQGGTLYNLLMQQSKPELELYIKRRAVLKNGQNIDQPLTPTEFDVLSEMYEYMDMVITDERIWEVMTADNSGHEEEQLGSWSDNELRISQLIAELRKKIERPGAEPVIVLDVEGVGYKMSKFKFLDMPPFRRRLGLV
jgi:pSer/pThr/pTyr-binding forkhead associated (FHA) protein